MTGHAITNPAVTNDNSDMTHPYELSDYVAEQALEDDPSFDDARGGVHDWRRCVGEHVQALWPTLPKNLRLAIAADAHEMASREEWE